MQSMVEASRSMPCVRWSNVREGAVVLVEGAAFVVGIVERTERRLDELGRSLRGWKRNYLFPLLLLLSKTML